MKQRTNKLYLITLAISLICYSAQAQVNSKRLILRTEVLTSLFIPSMAPGAWYFDIQGQLKITDHFHLVGNYAYNFHTFNNKYSVVNSNEKIESVLKGNSIPDYYGGIRIYPLKQNLNPKTNGFKSLFFEMGIRRRHRAESTEYMRYNGSKTNMNKHYKYEYEFDQTDYVIGFGYAPINPIEMDSPHSKIMFCPEFMFGLFKSETNYTKEKLTYYTGSDADLSHSNPPGFFFRIKVGVGFGH